MTAPAADDGLVPRLAVNDDIPDLAGKVALVTGANSRDGIGFHTAYQLASKGAKVYVGARSVSKAEHAIQEMKGENPKIGPDALLPFVADMSDMRNVKAAALRLRDTETRLDILVHNASVLSMPLELDSDGILVSFATNHLGPFVLTTELMPLLKKTAETSPGVRVVVVSAATYAFPPLGVRFDSRASFNAPMEDSAYGDAAFIRYGLSKLANLLFAKQLQKVFAAERINAIAVSLHPGLVKTDGSIKLLGPAKQHMLDGKMTPAEGALNSLFAATDPTVWRERERYGGAYLVPHAKIEAPRGNGGNAELAEELWRTSEQVVREVLGE